MIFPFLDVPADTKTEQQELPMFKEYAWDWEKDTILLKDGKTVIVQEKEALKVWIYNTLKTERYRYLAYSWYYGQEFDEIIGKTISKKAKEAEIKRYIKEAILSNYITDVTNLKVNSYDDSVSVEFIAHTIYGEVLINV